MKFLLTQVLLNFQWFCKNPIRCFLGGLLLLISMPLSALVLTDLKLGELANQATIFLTFGLTFSILLFAIGRLVKPLKLPKNWDSDKEESITTISKTLLLLPSICLLAIFIIHNIQVGLTIPLIIKLVSVFAPFGLVGIFLITKKPETTEYKIEETQEMKEFEEVSKTKSYKRMRLMVLVFSAQSLITIFLLVNSYIKNERLKTDLILMEHQNQYKSAELESQIDSLKNIVKEKSL